MEIQYRGRSDSQVQIKVQHFLVALVVSVFRPMEVMKVKHTGPPAHSCVILFLSIAIINQFCGFELQRQRLYSVSSFCNSRRKYDFSIV